MVRVIAINILLILAPFIFYAAYILIEKKPQTKEEFWALIPPKPLFALGLLFMSIFYITQITFQHPVKDGVYHPAVVRDGKVIPGYIGPAEEGTAKADVKTDVKADTNADTKADTKPDARSAADPGEKSTGDETDKANTDK